MGNFEPAWLLEQILEKLNQTGGAAVQVTITNPSSSGGGGTPADPSEANITQYGSTATTLGQKAMAASVPVVIASDQSNLPADIVGTGTYSDTSAVDAKSPTGATGNTEVLGVALMAHNEDASQFPRIRAGLGTSTSVITSTQANKVLNTIPIAQYNATAPTLADTNFDTLQFDSRANLKTVPGDVITVPTQITKTVAATGTPEALAADGTFFRSATLMGKKAARTNNTGIVYLGIGSTNDTQALEIAAGEVVQITAPDGQRYDLNDWYLDVLNAGDGVIIIYS